MRQPQNRVVLPSCPRSIRRHGLSNFQYRLMLQKCRTDSNLLKSRKTLMERSRHPGSLPDKLQIATIKGPIPDCLLWHMILSFAS
jgi:hypothetical protein